MMEHYIKKARWVKRAMFAAVPYESYLIYVHSAEYRIEMFNLKTERIERIFGRKFNPPKPQAEIDFQDPYERFDRGFNPPPQPNFCIQRLQIFRDNLWVKTSIEKDGGNKWQIDIFDIYGNYVDCIYLVFPKNNLKHESQFTLTNGGFIYVTEEDEKTGLITIGKYKIKL